jgi:hypothetical protein
MVQAKTEEMRFGRYILSDFKVPKTFFPVGGYIQLTEEVPPGTDIRALLASCINYLNTPLPAKKYARKGKEEYHYGGKFSEEPLWFKFDPQKNILKVVLGYSHNKSPFFWEAAVGHNEAPKGFKLKN